MRSSVPCSSFSESIPLRTAFATISESICIEYRSSSDTYTFEHFRDRKPKVSAQSASENTSSSLPSSVRST